MGSIGVVDDAICCDTLLFASYTCGAHVCFWSLNVTKVMLGEVATGHLFFTMCPGVNAFGHRVLR